MIENKFLNIRLLASLYVDQLLTEEDRIVTELLIERSPELKNFIQIYEAQREEEFTELEKEQNEMLDKIIVPDAIFGEEGKTGTRIIPLWSKFAAAASVLLFIGIGQGWYILNQKSKYESQISDLKKNSTQTTPKEIISRPAPLAQNNPSSTRSRDSQETPNTTIHDSTIMIPKDAFRRISTETTGIGESNNTGNSSPRNECQQGISITFRDFNQNGQSNANDLGYYRFNNCNLIIAIPRAVYSRYPTGLRIESEGSNFTVFDSNRNELLRLYDNGSSVEDRR